MSKADPDMMGRWSPKGSEDKIRTFRVVIKAVTDKFMDATRHGDIYETLDEEEVVEGMAKVRIFDKESCGSISAEQQGKRESVDKRAEVRGRELGPIEEHEEEDEQEAKYVIAEGRRSSGGTVACLHRRTGCFRGRGLTFRSFELVVWHACCSELHGVLQIMLATSRPNLRRGRGQHGQRRHLCEQRDIEQRVRGPSDTNSLMFRGGAKWIGQDSEEIISAGPLWSRGTQAVCGDAEQGERFFLPKMSPRVAQGCGGCCPAFLYTGFLSLKSRHERIDRGTCCWVHKRGLLRHQVLAGQGGL